MLRIRNFNKDEKGSTLVEYAIGASVFLMAVFGVLEFSRALWAHNALTDAGNETKTVLKKATGIKGSQSHEPGGLNKIARDISKTSKKAGSDVKAEKNRVKSKAHGATTEAGKSLKDTTLKGKP